MSEWEIFGKAVATLFCVILCVAGGIRPRKDLEDDLNAAFTSMVIFAAFSYVVWFM